ncbi:M23 family metallopeptidase [Streptomyces coeruleoprunus]|uniref:M23 family metallopeptidase n=1 Tax=Streptomyces coeruleoprunus TaxID=285563 RepID=A0ABV9XF71_9ACTN
MNRTARTLLLTALLTGSVTAAAPQPTTARAPGPAPAAAHPLPDAVWPLGPPRPAILHGWAPPASPYGPGHRGVDLAAPPGTPVRAAATGLVSFAGPVAGRGVLSLTLPAPPGATPLRTTYEPVRPLVPRGTEVRAGAIVAETTAAGAASHCTRTCLHWGLRRGDTYLDPLTLLPPDRLRRPPSRLLPVIDPLVTPPP